MAAGARGGAMPIKVPSRLLKNTVSSREKRLSTVTAGPYDPNAWRYDESGVPRPPVSEEEKGRAHVVALNSTSRRNTRTLTVIPSSSKLVSPEASKQASSDGSAPPSATASRRGPNTEEDKRSEEGNRRELLSLIQKSASAAEVVTSQPLTPGKQSTPSYPTMVTIGSHDVSNPEDLKTVRELREEVVRLKQGLPVQSQTKLAIENARLEAECERLRKRVEGYQLTMEQFGRRMAEMEAENVTLKVQLELAQKMGSPPVDESAALLNELSDLLRDERRKSRLSRGQEEAGEASNVRRDSSDFLELVRKANAALEAELDGPPKAPIVALNGAQLTTGSPAPDLPTGEASPKGTASLAVARDVGAVPPTASKEGEKSSAAEARLATAQQAEQRLRELEAEIRQTKVEEMAFKMRQIESKFNESLGKAAKPMEPFDALSLDEQLEELGLGQSD